MSPSLPALLRNKVARRAITVPTVTAAAATLAGTAGLWAPIATCLDLATARNRMPRVRILSFALAWSTLEAVGVGASSVLWAVGHADDDDANYALQRWWAARLVDALHHTAGVDIDVEGFELLTPGPIVMCVRHASIADSLLPAWLLGRVGMRPRYVLKDELLIDPCLDIVGNRLPNHFVDRAPDNSRAELAQLDAIAHGMGPRDAAVIFPEGMVVTNALRERAIMSVRTRDPARSARIADLRVLAPVRPGGTAALLSGAPSADLVFVNHTGLEVFQQITKLPSTVPLARRVQVEISRVPRAQVPTGTEYVEWLDKQWSALDRRLTDVENVGSEREERRRVQ
jgi:1-acyl-sn-glycerol-3-phosphate acyltransferase